MREKKKGPRHRVMAELADILPALTRLSLVGLLLSRAPLRFTEHGPIYQVERREKEVHPVGFSVKMGWV